MTSCSLLIIATSCSKGKDGVNGTDGADGATGATGPAGPAGSQGPAGPAGPAGSSPVIYSSWKYATNFNDSTIDGSALKVGYVACPALSTTILNRGEVKVYFTYGGGTFNLPYTSNAGGKVNTIAYTPMFNKILITRFTHDNSNSVTLSTLLQYRYVIIPGGVSGRFSSIVDWNDYAAVAAYLGWKD